MVSMGSITRFFFWMLLKIPLKQLFDNFIHGKLDIGRLNIGTITLIPKCEDAVVTRKFRPIYLMNGSLKIITINNRLAHIDEHIIYRTQPTFMKK